MTFLHIGLSHSLRKSDIKHSDETQSLIELDLAQRVSDSRWSPSWCWFRKIENRLTLHPGLSPADIHGEDRRVSERPQCAGCSELWYRST